MNFSRKQEAAENGKYKLTLFSCISISYVV